MLLLFDLDAFLTDGFQANNRLPKAPRGRCPVRRFFMPQDLAFSAANLLRVRESLQRPSTASRRGANRALGCGEFPLFDYPALTGRGKSARMTLSSLG
jgi:hypothetical protein